jgi:hypothetical protein
VVLAEELELEEIREQAGLVDLQDLLDQVGLVDQVAQQLAVTTSLLSGYCKKGR